MSPDSNFDVDSVLAVIATVSEKYPRDSPEDAALRAAAVALLYVRDTQKLDDYRAYLRGFLAPAVATVTVSQTFASRAEADAWLTSGKAQPEELVRIAGQGFRVITGRAGPRFLRTPLPEEMETPE